MTPQVLVNAEADGVEVPQKHVVDGQIVLNISSAAVQLHVMDNECLSFSARFSGVEQDIFLPIDSILAIFARENSQGIFFEDADEEHGDASTGAVLAAVESEEPKQTLHEDEDDTPPRPSGGPHLKIIK